MNFGTRHPKSEEIAVVSSVDALTGCDENSLDSEKRGALRHRVLKGANIRFNKGFGAYDCLVKNLSDTGALIKMEDSTGLPRVFDFVISDQDMARPASIVWRKNGMAGVRFL